MSTFRNVDPVVQSFIEYHLSIGFKHIFLFFDDPQDVSIEKARRYKDVTVLLHNDELRQQWRQTITYKILPQFVKYLDREVASRQILNVEIAIGMSREMGIHWLLHIDNDELFYSPVDTVEEHFAKLSNTNFGSMTYFNFEAVPESIETGDFFKDVTLFKKNKNRLTLRQINRIDRVEKSESFLPFIAYESGKSAGRVSPHLIPSTVHYFYCYPPPELSPDAPAAFRKGFTLGSHTDPIILHYPACGFQTFWDKYQTLGRFEDKWFGYVDIYKAAPFHIEARNIVQAADRGNARTFYEERCMLTDKILANKLIEEELLCRITAPREILNHGVYPSASGDSGIPRRPTSPNPNGGIRQ